MRQLLESQPVKKPLNLSPDQDPRPADPHFLISPPPSDYSPPHRDRRMRFEDPYTNHQIGAEMQMRQGAEAAKTL